MTPPHTHCPLKTKAGPQVSRSLRAQSYLQAFTHAGTSACNPLPRAITLSVRNRDPIFLDTAAWLRARGQALRTRVFRVWWGEGGEGPQDERLPEAGPSAPPPPSDSVGGAGPGAAVPTATQSSTASDTVNKSEGNKSCLNQEVAGSPALTRFLRPEMPLSWSFIGATPLFFWCSVFWAM